MSFFHFELNDVKISEWLWFVARQEIATKNRLEWRQCDVDLGETPFILHCSISPNFEEDMSSKQLNTFC